VDGARGVAEGRVGRADPAAGPDPAPQQLEQDGERVGVPQGHHAHLDVGVQVPGRADPPPGQERLGVRQPFLGEPGRLDGHHDEDSFPGQPEQLGRLPQGVPVGDAPGEHRLHQGRALPGTGEQQLRRGLPVGHRELLGVLADEPPHAAGGVDEGVGRRPRAPPALLHDRLPELGEADPVGVEDVGQGRALLGAAAAGGARRRQVGRLVGGQLCGIDSRLFLTDPRRSSRLTTPRSR
jgi:hypothetical protein